MDPKRRFFSFRTGIPGSVKGRWELDDVKIPAYNIKQAITMYFWLQWFKKKDENPWMSNVPKMFYPDRFWVNYYTRQVIEYELKGNKYYFQVNYKRVKTWNTHEYLQYFEQEKPM